MAVYWVYNWATRRDKLLLRIDLHNHPLYEIKRWEKRGNRAYTRLFSHHNETYTMIDKWKDYELYMKKPKRKK